MQDLILNRYGTTLLIMWKEPGTVPLNVPKQGYRIMRQVHSAPVRKTVRVVL